MVEQNWQDLEKEAETPPVEEVVLRLSFACVAVVVGVTAAFGLIGFFCPTLRPQSLSWGSLLLLAVGLLLVAGVVSAGVARWIARRGPGSSSGIVGAAWIAALWVPAWVLCLQAPSLLTVLAACFCAVSVARSLRRYDVERGAIAVERAKGGLFWIDDSKALVKVILPSVVVAVIAEGAVIAIFGGRYRLASLLMGGCAAALVWRVASRGLVTDDAERDVERSRKILSLGLAFLFTMVVLLPYLKGRRLFSTGDMLLAKSVGGRSGEKGLERANGSDGYTGIILLPLAETHTAIVAPRRKDSASASGRPAQPMVIPFDGVYWYFKAPDRRPRPSARVVRGSSTKALIRSSDRYPLLMEAHQRLGMRVDLGCCGGVQIVLQNADRRAGAIALELWFTDSLQPRSRSYLGMVTIPSSEVEGLRELPAEETMAFPVPVNAVGREFDEITVVVRTAEERARVGAQIAIRRFVLMP